MTLAAGTRFDGALAFPVFLPDGRHFLFVVFRSPTEASMYVGSLDSTDAKPLSIRMNSYMAYSRPGYLLFARDSALMAQPFDVAHLLTTGDAVPIAEADTKSSALGFTASESGTLIYRSSSGAQTQLVWADRTGKQTGLAAPSGLYGNVTLSPDDKRLATEWGPRVPTCGSWSCSDESYRDSQPSHPSIMWRCGRLMAAQSRLPLPAMAGSTSINVRRMPAARTNLSSN